MTTLPADISGGAARISGAVVGPAGPVPNANIRVERLLGTQVSTLNVISTATGQYNLPSVRGGHYRVRAWRPPDLLMLQPEAFFLAADEQKALDLRLAAAGETNIQTAVEPSPIPKEEPFNIVVTVYSGSVTSEGALQGTTRNGLAVLLALRTNLGLQGPDRGTTDATGKVVFRVRCGGAGPAGADAVFGTLALPLRLPDCPA
ncbi:MAG: carboxypeptidase-like regulatory domain-containing protein [Acidimicrobiales bacterium]